jgi:RNA polymerase sigma-70 factor (ECF subfamily)
MKSMAAREKAFDELFSVYARGLVLYAKRLVGSEEEARDIVHDVFVSFWEKSGRLTDDNIKAYLFRSARNRCLDRLAKLKRGDDLCRRMMAQSEELDRNIDLFVEQEAMGVIMRAVDRLSPQRRRVFIMSKIEGRTFADIADELGISPKTVDKHLEMAVRCLRRELAGEADEL